MNKKNILTILLALPLLVGYGFLVQAAAPSGGYTPGATLDPDCAPGDTDCIVQSSGGGSSQWTDAGSDIYFDAGNVGIGTTTPGYDLDVTGTFNATQVDEDVYPGIDLSYSMFNKLPFGGTLQASGFAVSNTFTSAGVFAIMNEDTTESSVIVSSGAAIDPATLNVGSTYISMQTGNSSDGYGALYMDRQQLFFRDITDSTISSPSTEMNAFLFDMSNPAIRLGSVDEDNWDQSNRGDRSIAIGFAAPDLGPGFRGPLADGIASIALGTQTTSSGIGSLAAGFATTATGNGSTALGTATTASGDSSFAAGDQSVSSGYGSAAIGNTTTASGYGSFAAGSQSVASGYISFAFGNGVEAPSAYEAVFGRSATVYTPASVTAWDSADRLFSVANGTGLGTESDAFTILKSGLTGIGIDNFEANNSGDLFQVGGSFSAIASNDYKISTNSDFLDAGLDGAGVSYNSANGLYYYNGIVDATPLGSPLIASLGFINFNNGTQVTSSATFTSFTTSYSNPVGDIMSKMVVDNASANMTFGDNDLSSNENRLSVYNGAFDYTFNDIIRFMVTSSGDVTLSDAVYASCTDLTTNSGGTIICSPSDERLKNIQSEYADGLSVIRTLDPQVYTWKDGTGYEQDGTYIGFMAQNIQAAIPDAVRTDHNGYLNIQERPILAAAVNAIKELDLTIQDIENLATGDSEFGTMLRDWFADATNGIQKLFVKEVQTDRLCVGERCITEDQLGQILDQMDQNPYGIMQPVVESGDPIEEGTYPSGEEVPADPEAPSEEVVTDPIPETPVESPAPEEPSDESPESSETPTESVVTE